MAPRVQITPVPFNHMLLDGSWRPDSADLSADHVIAGGRTVSVGYLAGRSPRS